jgi:hypothetical protein
VLSEYGNGSKFYFDLDLLSEESSDDGLLQHTENDIPTLIENPSAIFNIGGTGAEGQIQELRFQRTLIVDDSLMNRKLMRKLLTSYFDQIDEVSLL